MAARKRTRKPRASNLCGHFTDTVLADCAKAGLDALEAKHKEVITTSGRVACGVHMDLCRKYDENDRYAERWDYVFTLRGGDECVAVEVHHATAEELEKMLLKQIWAKALLRRECPALTIKAWVWVAPPGKDDNILFTRQHPAARALAENGIEFPMKRLQLP